MDPIALPTTKLYFDQDMTRAECHPFADGAATVYSSRCPGRAAANEDAAALIPFTTGSGVLAVADGLGGAVAGDHAACLAIQALRTSIEEGRRQETMLRTAILNGIEAANQSVQALGGGAATTLAAVEVQGDTIRPYHVGDSMILVVGLRGKIKLKTVSHSPVGFAVEAGLLDQGEAMYHEDRHLVSNVIGSVEMKIEIGPTLRMAARDSVLLASDGLFDNLHVEEIVERLRKGPLDRSSSPVLQQVQGSVVFGAISGGKV
ncbi:MAG: protein phosphatase 2C domain-containing protein [Planctomycetota bacterium]